MVIKFKMHFSHTSFDLTETIYFLLLSVLHCINGNIYFEKKIFYFNN